MFENYFQNLTFQDWNETIQSSSSIIRMQAIIQCVSFIDEAESVVAAIIPMLEDESAGVRTLAAWVLGNFGSKATTAIPKLVSLLDDSTDATCNITHFAIEALENIAPDVASHETNKRSLTKSKFSLLLDSCWCQDTRIDVVFPIVLIALQQSDFTSRMEALRILKLFGAESKPLLPTIVSSLDDKHYVVRVAAIQTIRSIGLQPNEIKQLLKPLLDDENRLVRVITKGVIEKQTSRE